MRLKLRSLLILAAGIVLAAGMVCACGKGTEEDTGGIEEPAPKKEEVPVTEISSLRVMSFNILRGDLQGPDHLWAVRREACLDMIAQESPMLFGLQECTWTQRRHILGSNSLLDAVGVAVNGQTKDYTNVSSNPIFWRKDILTLKEWGTFWLSDTPDAIGSITWNGSKPRTCTWARFTVRCTGKNLFYFNAHIENASGEDTKKKSIALIIERIKEKNPSWTQPILFGGDLNSAADKNCLKALFSYLDLASATCPETDKGRTLNTFKETGTSVLDHLFFNGSQLKGLKFWVDRNPYKNVTYISDHYPIFCELEFN